MIFFLFTEVMKRLLYCEEYRLVIPPNVPRSIIAFNTLGYHMSASIPQASEPYRKGFVTRGENTNINTRTRYYYAPQLLMQRRPAGISHDAFAYYWHACYIRPPSLTLTYFSTLVSLALTLCLIHPFFTLSPCYHTGYPLCLYRIWFQRSLFPPKNNLVIYTVFFFLSFFIYLKGITFFMLLVCSLIFLADEFIFYFMLTFR